MEFDLVFFERVFVLIFFLGICFSVANEVYANVYTEINYDWRFHSCFVSSFDASGCSNNGYSSYAPLVFLPAYFLVKAGFPVWISFSMEFILVFILFARFLIEEGGLIGFLAFFYGVIVVEHYFGFLSEVNWFFNVRTGFLPFYIALALGLFLLVKWYKLTWLKRGLLFVGVVLAHNYGLALALFLILLVCAEELTKVNRVMVGLFLLVPLVVLGLFPNRLWILIELLGSIALGKFVNFLVSRIFPA